MFKRIGTCNQCGECCGFPRKTDHGQNNPWPIDWPEGLATWDEKDKEKDSPVFRILGHIDRAGNHHIGGKKLSWIFVKDHGLCKMIVDANGLTSWDQRCPFLADKQEDGTVPCLIYGSIDHDIWLKCNETPLEYLEQAQVDYWKEHCPSCSFEWVEE